MRYAFVLCIALLAIGCEKELADGPPTIKYGVDKCDHCNMIISDARCAAAMLVRVDGKRKAVLFDDIGDLIDWQREHVGTTVERRYVADYATREWVAFDQALFVHAPEAHTPMGSGILAFAKQADADSATQGGAGRIVSVKQLEALRAPATQQTTSKGCCTEGVSG